MIGLIDKLLPATKDDRYNAEDDVVGPVCSAKIALGLSKQDADGKTLFEFGPAAAERAVRRVVEAHFPGGYTIVKARGGWRFKPGAFVRESSVIVELHNLGASTCPAFYQQVDGLARVLCQTFRQYSSLVQYVGAEGTRCFAFVTGSGHRKRVRGASCKTLLNGVKRPAARRKVG